MKRRTFVRSSLTTAAALAVPRFARAVVLPSGRLQVDLDAVTGGGAHITLRARRP